MISVLVTLAGLVSVIGLLAFENRRLCRIVGELVDINRELLRMNRELNAQARRDLG